MSYDEDSAPASGLREPAAEPQAEAQAEAGARPDGEADLAELRRSLLIYGTAGQGSRPGVAARAS